MASPCAVRKSGGMVRAATLVATGQPGTLQISPPIRYQTANAASGAAPAIWCAGLSRDRRAPAAAWRAELVDRAR
jgi:hypothetical protein